MGDNALGRGRGPPGRVHESLLSPGSPKTVLYLTPSVRLLGARRSLLALATSLDPERWRPVVCGQSEGDLSAALAENGIRFEVVRLGWWRKGKYFLWRPFAIARLAALIRRTGADLVHCNEIYPNPYAIRACASLAKGAPGRRIPVVTHMRLSVTPRMIRNYDLKLAERIVVPSIQAGRDFDIWPDKDRHVRVIHNGVDLHEFSRRHSRAEARRMIGLPPEGPLLGLIGQIGPRKGGDVVIAAMKRVASRFPDARLLFIGNPHRGQEEFERNLRRASTAPELAGRVTFFPFTREILPYYEALDVNLLVSRDEGFRPHHYRGRRARRPQHRLARRRHPRTHRRRPHGPAGRRR
jgi:glycosyltransferase involved in cell wall biosynthesis